MFHSLVSLCLRQFTRSAMKAVLLQICSRCLPSSDSTYLPAHLATWSCHLYLYFPPVQDWVVARTTNHQTDIAHYFPSGNEYLQLVYLLAGISDILVYKSHSYLNLIQVHTEWHSFYSYTLYGELFIMEWLSGVHLGGGGGGSKSFCPPPPPWNILKILQAKNQAKKVLSWWLEPIDSLR